MIIHSSQQKFGTPHQWPHKKWFVLKYWDNSFDDFITKMIELEQF